MIGRQREAIILSLIENFKCNGSWCGETHIQKAAYFLQELLCVSLEINFILYKHCPYSFDLKEILDSMQCDFILQSKTNNPNGLTFLPGETSNQIKETYQKTIQEYKEKILFITQKLSNKDVPELERLATTIYVLKNKAVEGCIEDQARMINELMPQFSYEKVLEAVKIVNPIIEEAKKFELCHA